jgi:hypothetical protein
MTTILTSSKRTYQIFLNDSLLNKCIKHCASLPDYELQTYITDCFRKASNLGNSRKQNAWGESKIFRDKAKIGIIELDNRKVSPS